MSPMSNYLSGKIINHILRDSSYTPTAYTYLALYSASIVDGVTETELTGGGYARQRLNPFTQIQFNYYSNNFGIMFGPASSSWSIKAVAIKDSLTSGNMLYYTDVSTYGIAPGQFLFINAYDLNIEHLQTVNNQGGWTWWINPHIIEMVLNNNPYTLPSEGAVLALGRDVVFDPLDGYTLFNWTECSGQGYERVLVSGADLWTVPSTAGSSVNTQSFTFKSSGLSWGTISDVVIFENTPGDEPPDLYGDWIFWGHLATPVTIIGGEAFVIPAGGIKLDLR